VVLTPDQIDQGGLYIYTTLDPAVQNAATQALESTLTRIEHQSNFHHPLKSNYHPPEDGEDSSMPYLEGAVVVIDNASGGIRALVGGRDYSQSKFNRALPPANRQVGSAFKPFVYTLAFTNGLLPGASISDGPIQPGEIEGSGNWAPGNSDGTYGGIQPASYGLIHSRNTMSVRVGQFAGLDQVQKVATALNLNDKVPHGPAIYIGSFETSLKDLTTAYTAFPNAGMRKQSYVIERIDDQNHQPIYRAAHISAPALDPSAAWMTSQLMEEVLTHGTAASARSLGFKLPARARRDTNDYKDAWFVGYTSTLTCGVWVGFDQPTTIISRGYGAALALPVWVQVMNKSAARYPAKALEPTMPMARVTVCAASNAWPRLAAKWLAALTKLCCPPTRFRRRPVRCMAANRRSLLNASTTFPRQFRRSFNRSGSSLAGNDRSADRRWGELQAEFELPKRHKQNHLMTTFIWKLS
jgi:Membrane carboxypeptidase/penicillin-binding protein